MPTPRELVKANTDLADQEVDRLERLLGSWQLVADLSFADLLLWCRRSAGAGYICVAQIRPHTAQTLHPDDEFAKEVSPGEVPALDRAFGQGAQERLTDSLSPDSGQVHLETIPILAGGKVAAVISKESAPLMDRRPGRLEQNYLECAAALWRMIEIGTFPFAGNELDPELAPRVGDGMIRLDSSGKVLYASPNAISAYRRLGIASNIEGEKLSEVGVDVTPASLALSLGVPAEGDVEVANRVVLQRAIPFVEGPRNKVTGGILLLRDVTELRYRERQLERKETVISEVHHRVKNNLQTIASLLRIQARRLPAEARQELEEAVRRIASIALVHETLSKEPGQSVDFREVAGRLVEMVQQGLIDPGRRIDINVQGDTGSLQPEMATPLAIVLVELLQNCVEHAFGPEGGTVTVRLSRDESSLHLIVEDTGKGLPESFGQPEMGLGLQIVGTLVESELQGKISLSSIGGTSVDVRIPLKARTGLGL